MSLTARPLLGVRGPSSRGLAFVPRGSSWQLDSKSHGNAVHPLRFLATTAGSRSDTPNRPEAGARFCARILLASPLTRTQGNMADSRVLPDLLDGEETRVFL